MQIVVAETDPYYTPITGFPKLACHESALVLINKKGNIRKTLTDKQCDLRVQKVDKQLFRSERRLQKLLKKRTNRKNRTKKNIRKVNRQIRKIERRIETLLAAADELKICCSLIPTPAPENPTPTPIPTPTPDPDSEPKFYDLTVSSSDPACSDDGPGTAEQPLCSLSQAVQLLGEQGGSIHLRNGNYQALSLEDTSFINTLDIYGESKQGVEIESLRLVNTDNISLQNFSIHGSSNGVSDTRNLTLKNFYIRGPGRHSNEAALYITGEQILIDTCEVSHGNRALMLNGVRDTTVRNCEIHSSSGSAFRISDYSNNILIEHNRIYDADHSVAESEFCLHGGPRPFWGSGTCDENSEYVHESSENPHENLLILRGTTNAVVRNNMMWNTRALGLTIRDGPNSSSPRSGANILVENNIVLAGFWAMSGEVTVRNNNFSSAKIGSTGSGVWGPSVVDQFTGNLVFAATTFYLTSGTTIRGPVDYNIVSQAYGRGTSASTLGENSIVERDLPETLIYSRDDFDFRLRPGTIAIGMVPSLYAAPHDYFENDRQVFASVGAVEFEGSPPSTD